MSDVKDLAAALQGIKEDFVALQAQSAALAGTLDTVLANIAALKAQVDAGTPVTQADLDALTADAQAADAAGDLVKEALNAAQVKAEAGTV